jgi:hypothetical protein
MPILDEAHVKQLLALAGIHGVCNECGQKTAMDYCRTCDEFYWLHRRGCMMYCAKHFGHRLTIVPFVEDRSK